MQQEYRINKFTTFNFTTQGLITPSRICNVTLYGPNATVVKTQLLLFHGQLTKLVCLHIGQCTTFP